VEQVILLPFPPGGGLVSFFPPCFQPKEGVLEGIAARASNDIWAVGWTYDHNNNDVFRPLTVHWDGVCWSEVWCPTLGSEAQLFAVTYLPEGDAFAVGGYLDPQQGLNLTFAVHWDAKNKVWNISPTLNVPNADNFLFGVFGTSKKDVWAVGHSEGPQWQNLAQHWDGNNCTTFPTPSPDSPQDANGLNSVTATAPDDFLAAGISKGNTLIERWDGLQWSVVPTPNDPNTAMFGWDGLLGIAIGGAVDIWSVGEYTPNQIAAEMLILHGDFNKWTVYPHPVIGNNKPQNQHRLRGVSVDPAGNAWAVGYDAVDLGNAIVRHTLIVNRTLPNPLWNLSVDQPNGTQNELNGVAAIAPADVWAVGSYHHPKFIFPFCLFEHWDGNQWKSFP